MSVKTSSTRIQVVTLIRHAVGVQLIGPALISPSSACDWTDNPPACSCAEIQVVEGRLEAAAIDRCTGTRYNHTMIRSFRHRGLRRLYERGDPSKIGGDQLDRITLALADLDVATKPSELDLPGYRLHPLRGDRRGSWMHFGFGQLANHLPI